MNLCGKFLCVAAFVSLCAILKMGIYEESAFYMDTECGNRDERVLWLPYRFLGGYPIDISAWPWVVSLQHRTSSSSPFTQRCSGAVIRKDWILTASSCFYEPAYKNFSNWRVISGSSDLKVEDNHTQTSAIEDVVLNKAFHPESAAHNIALVKLAAPLVLNSHVDRVCIPDLMNVEQYKYGSCQIAGHDGTTPAHLGNFEESAVQIIPHSRCNMLTWRKFKVTADMFCAGFRDGGIDGCETTTGGPLSCFVPTTGRYYVRGIRIVTTKCGVIRRPNIYLQVSKYYHWIERYIEIYESTH